MKVHFVSEITHDLVITSHNPHRRLLMTSPGSHAQDLCNMTPLSTHPPLRADPGEGTLQHHYTTDDELTGNGSTLSTLCKLAPSSQPTTQDSLFKTNTIRKNQLEMFLHSCGIFFLHSHFSDASVYDDLQARLTARSKVSCEISNVACPLM